eukprot:gene1981-1489_t
MTKDENSVELEDEEERLAKEKKIKEEQEQNLVDDLKPLFNDKDSCDVTFLVGDISKKEELKPCHAHKIILAARCPFFRGLFFMGFKETKMKEIKIPNISYDIFVLFIEYLYTGNILITKEIVMQLLPVADQYNVDNLRRGCFEFLVKNINKDSVIQMLLEAQDGKYRFNCDELISKCLKFIEKNTSDVIKTPQFFLFEERTVLEMVQSNNLNVEEIDLFKAIIRWGNYRRRDLNCTTPLTEIVQNLVPYIRYPLMSGPDLVNVVKPCKVAPEDLYIAALEFVNAPEHITPNGLQYKERSGEGSHFHWSFDRTEQMKQFEYVDKSKKMSFKKLAYSDWTNCFVFGSQTLKSGIHYWEIKVDKTQGLDGCYFGVTKDKQTSYYSNDICCGGSGGKYNCQGSDIYASQGDRLGVKLDFKKLKLTFYRNGSPAGITATLSKGQSYTPVIHIYYQNDQYTLDFPKKIPKD